MFLAPLAQAHHARDAREQQDVALLADAALQVWVQAQHLGRGRSEFGHLERKFIEVFKVTMSERIEIPGPVKSNRSGWEWPPAGRGTWYRGLARP
jgi:hypothetical protein